MITVKESNIRETPRTIPTFNIEENTSFELYESLVPVLLKKILPEQFLFQDWDNPETCEDLADQLNNIGPLFKWKMTGKLPCNFSFFLLSKYRSNGFKYFFDMISHWLIPGKRLNVTLFYAIDIRFPDFNNDVYTLSQVSIMIENQRDLQELQNNLPIVESEIRLGVESSFYARRILETKGITNDQKVASVQEDMTYLISRLPKEFDCDLLTEAQHVLVLCRDKFKSIREGRHISRIICIHYLYRKHILNSMKTSLNKRHMALKLVKSKLQLPEGEKSVLGIILAINFLNEKEVLEERHLLKAIKNYVPNVKIVPESFFANKRGSEKILTLYMEIEKGDGLEFSIEEMQRLRMELPHDLKDRIEHLMHPIFMPRNEEEIMRNILTLNNQIRFLRDIPQVVISFDEQTNNDLFFTIIFVRVLKPKDHLIEELFKSIPTQLNYIHDRRKVVGKIRKKYSKEATVFRVQVAKDQFLRSDHSIDLYKARQLVVSELTKVVGEFRDFNGGMISKQNELLCAVRNLLVDVGKYNDLLLENFFYSLTPVIMRNVLDPEPLKKLFLILIQTVEEGLFRENNESIRFEEDPGYCYVMITSDSISLRERLYEKLKKITASTELASAFVTIYDIPCLGYIFRCEDSKRVQKFRQLIEKEWK